MATRKRDTTGAVDGGEGRGVPMGGRDRGRLTGLDPRESAEDEPEIIEGDLDLDELLDDGDFTPGDRRRDPLRRP